MEKYENKILKRRIFSLTLALLITITGFSVAFSSDFVAASRNPVEYAENMNIKNVRFLPGATNIKYVKSTLKGNNKFTVYTIVEGKHTPLNLDFFLKPHAKDSNTQFTLITPRSKIIYAIEDLDDNRTLQLNTIEASMEPIVFESSDGEYIAIRYSKSFLEENNIPLTENHEIFEVGVDKEDTKKIPKEIEKFIYFDGRKGTLVAITKDGTVESDDITKVGENTLKDNIVTNSNVFNVGIISKEGMKPDYLGEIDNADNTGTLTERNPLPAQPEPEGFQKSDKQLDEEMKRALEEQKRKADENSSGKNGNTDNNGITIDYQGNVIVNKGSLPQYKIDDINSLNKAMGEFPNTYGLILTPEFLKTLGSRTLEKIYKDASMNKWNNAQIIKTIFTQKYKEELKKGIIKPGAGDYDQGSIGNNTSSDLEYKNALRDQYIDKIFKSNFGEYNDSSTGFNTELKEGKWYNPLTREFEDIKNYDGTTTDAYGNKKNRNAYRFQWGRLDQNNLNGLTDENSLLLKNVYNYWDVNLVDTDLKKLDASSLTQTPSEQLIPSTIEFEPIETTSTILFKLSVFGLSTTITYIAIFWVARKINQRRSVEEFQKDTLFKMEKINLDDFNSNNFDLGL